MVLFSRKSSLKLVRARERESEREREREIGRVVIKFRGVSSRASFFEGDLSLLKETNKNGTAVAINPQRIANVLQV